MKENGTTTEVVQDHVYCRPRGYAEGDLSNYSAEVILLTDSGRYNGLRASAAELNRLVGVYVQRDSGRWARRILAMVRAC